MIGYVESTGNTLSSNILIIDDQCLGNSDFQIVFEALIFYQIVVCWLREKEEMSSSGEITRSFSVIPSVEIWDPMKPHHHPEKCLKIINIALSEHSNKLIPDGFLTYRDLIQPIQTLKGRYFYGEGKRTMH